MFETAKAKIKSAMRKLIFSEKFSRWIRSGESTITGVNVDEESVYSLSVVYACVNAIAQTIGSLPVILYKRVGNGKERFPKHYLYDLLHDNPNPNILPATFQETIMTNVLTWGNGYAEIEFDNAGRPLAFWPIHASRVKPKLIGKELFYDVYLDTKTARLPADRIFHVPGLSFNGIEGITPIQKSREAFGMALATQEHGGRYFKHDASGGLILSHPGRLGKEAHDRMKSEIEEMRSGLDKKFRILLLQDGIKPDKMGLSPQDSQLLEERKFSVNDIARMFRVPPHIIGDLDRATFSNIEHLSIEFLTHCILPWVVKYEQAILRRVVPQYERKEIFAKFLVSGLLRGDIKTRYDAYGVGLDRGFLCVNDVRRMEDMNEVEGGEQYYKALNLAPINGPQGEHKK